MNAVRAFSARGPALLFMLVLATSCLGHAASNVIQSITVSGPNVTGVSCPSIAYLSCYKITNSSIDAFGLTSGSGLRTLVTPSASAPTSAWWISDANVSFQVGPTLNGQTASISIYAVTTGGFTHTYLSPQYCTGVVCTNFTAVPPASTVLYSNATEGPSGGPASRYALSLATLIYAGNGASFASFGTPGVQGDTFQLVVHVASTAGNKIGDCLITIDVQQAASAIMTSVTYPNTLGPAFGLPLSASQALTSTPFVGAITYGTAYSFTPHFSQFSSTTGTLKAYVSTDFAPLLAANSVALCDAASNATNAVCTPISKSASAPTTISTALTDSSTLSHYMGLIVAEGVGFPGNSTTGTTNAVASFVFSVP